MPFVFTSFVDVIAPKGKYKCNCEVSGGHTINAIKPTKKDSGKTAQDSRYN